MKRQETLRDEKFCLLLNGNQSVHRTKQVVIGRLALFISGKVYTIAPLQKGKLAARIAQTVHNHQFDQICRGKGCLYLICIFWLSANAITFGQVSEE